MLFISDMNPPFIERGMNASFIRKMNCFYIYILFLELCFIYIYPYTGCTRSVPIHSRGCWET